MILLKDKRGDSDVLVYHALFWERWNKIRQAIFLYNSNPFCSVLTEINSPKHIGRVTQACVIPRR